MSSHGITLEAIALGTVLSILTTILGTYEKEGADGDPLGIVRVLIGAFLGGMGGTFQFLAKTPFFPGASLGTVLGTLLKRIIDGTFDLLGDLPQWIMDLLANLKNLADGATDVFFTWIIPIIEQTPFEILLTILLSSWTEVLFDAVLSPITESLADTIMELVHQTTKSLWVRHLLPDEVRRILDMSADLYENITPLLQERTLISGSSCTCVKTRT